jgi:hypothetical protein
MKDSSEHKKPRILTQEEAARERQNMTYEQRFDLLMKLIRLQKMMKGDKNNPTKCKA